jgi:hypothetical protein
MRRVTITFAVVLAAALALLVTLGLTRKSDLVYAPGALASGPVVGLTDGEQACQGPYRVPSGDAFDRVSFTLTTSGEAGAPVRVTVREAGGGRELGQGRLAGGYADNQTHVVEVGRVETTEPIDVCLENEGGPRVAVFGQADIASPHTSATLDGKPAKVDMAVDLRTHERSQLALVPAMVERASRFRAGWLTPAVYWVLGLAILVGAPLLLARGIVRAAAEDGDARA